MAINIWDPFASLSRLDQQFDELFRRAWGSGLTRGLSGVGYVPASEVRTEGSDEVITLELPGVDIDKDVEIEVHQGRLTVRGKREERAEDKRGETLVRELRYGSFVREFALPEGVSADQVSADYDKGMLEIRVRGAVRAEEQPRKVAISRRAPTIEGESK